VKAPLHIYKILKINLIGANQNSDTLHQLRSLIANRREKPHAGVGFWRWGITLTAGVSEIVVHSF